MDSKLMSTAKKLRKHSTDAENLLWKYLRSNQLGFKFKRQQPIGNYIVDFVCFKTKLIIEVDGSQHLGSKKDVERDNFFKKQGFRILRFWNNDVFTNTTGILETIYSPLPPTPSHQGRGNNNYSPNNQQDNPCLLAEGLQEDTPSPLVGDLPAGQAGGQGEGV